MRVVSPGTRALVVDMGRPGLRHMGVPLSGAADRHSFQIANWLVGNAPGAGALECTLGGLRVEMARAAVVAVCGAETGLRIDGRDAPLWTAHRVGAGATVSLGATAHGVRSYLAVSGGVEGERHFGSLSTYPLAGLGANGGRALVPGDALEVGEASGASRELPASLRPRLSNHVTLRARSLGEWERLSPESKRRLFVAPWRAGGATSRMGARLDSVSDGGKLELSDDRPLVSSPLLPGTLQIPPDGRPILSLVDGHCTGGYARAIQVIASDMWVAGQVGPGTTVSFHRAFEADPPAILAARMATWGSVIEGYAV